jgi:DnaJ like chaperone protein
MIGKLVGGGIGLMFGFPGLLAGLAAGHILYDKRRQHSRDFIRQARDAGMDIGGNLDQVAFTVGVVILGAKMAKADGQVTRREIDVFKRVFKIPPQQEASLATLFDQARQDVNGYEAAARQLAMVFRQRPAVLEELLTGLMLIAAADQGVIGEVEEKFLTHVAQLFGFSAYEYRMIAARSGAYAQSQSRQRTGGASASAAGGDPYEILGVERNASPEAIKRAYRELMKSHHPDRLLANGMAPEFVTTATEKIKRLNVAYEIICRERGIK